MKAIIFDLDGVIVDTEYMNFLILKEILSKKGLNIKEEEYINHFMGQKTRTALLDFFSGKQTIVSEISTEFIEIKKQIINTRIKEFLRLREGSIECIKGLYKDFALGLNSISKKEFALPIIKTFNLTFYFNEITTGDEIKNNKPSPDIYLLAAQKMKLNPHNCIVIEDSEDGVISANSAGMKCIVVPNEFTKKQNFMAANMVLKNFKEITPELINRFF